MKSKKKNKQEKNLQQNNDDGFSSVSISLPAFRTVPDASRPTRTVLSLCPVRPSARHSANTNNKMGAIEKQKYVAYRLGDIYRKGMETEKWEKRE